MTKNQAQTEMVHAKATTHVRKYEPTVYDRPAQGPALAKIHLEESFSGDIEGDGIVECVQAANYDSSANLVGLERVVATIAGKQGTFLLQITAEVRGKQMLAAWFVIPRSGTGQLTGLRGKGGFDAQLGESGHVTLDYWFE